LAKELSQEELALTAEKGMNGWQMRDSPGCIKKLPHREQKRLPPYQRKTGIVLTVRVTAA
jgi:hypothetical protein